MRNTRKLKPFQIAIIVLLTIAIAMGLTIGILTGVILNMPKDAPDRISSGILPTQAQIDNAIKYDRVLIIGVDGAGGYFGETNTPNFDKVFGKGSITYSGLSQKPTISAQNWGAMLHGVTYQTHHITNAIATVVPWMQPKYPSIFKAYSNNNKQAKFLSSVTWTPINYGIIENINGLKKLYPSRTFKGKDSTEQLIDSYNCDITIDALNSIDPSIAFVHFDSVDHAGHSFGYASPEYDEAIKKIDVLIGKLYDAYVNKGWEDNTLFILVADHGHTYSGGHGGESDTEKFVTFAVAGNKGNVIKGTMGKFITHDLAAVVMYALGVQQPSTWEGRVPENLFNTL